MNEWCERIRKIEASYDKKADKEWAQTEQLKNDLRRHRDASRGLTPQLFDRILSWKLRGQRARTEEHRRNVEKQMLNDITACAFKLTHANRECLAAARLKLLSSLPGVGYGVASSMMALVFPEQYGGDTIEVIPNVISLSIYLYSCELSNSIIKSKSASMLGL